MSTVYAPLRFLIVALVVAVALVTLLVVPAAVVLVVRANPDLFMGGFPA